MRLALTGGGTGGHIIPAMTVLEAVRAAQPADLEVRWFGPEDRGERDQVERFGVQFESVPAAAVRGKSPLRVAKAALQLARGTYAAWDGLRRFKPDVVFSTGGYGSFPCCVAARLQRKPLVVYLPDVEPGWAVRVEKRLATRLATTTNAALAFLPREKTTVTGYPVRREFSQTREEARAALGLNADDRVVVIAGATQGARALNQAVFRGLRTLVEEAVVYHVTGKNDMSEAAGFCEALGEGLLPRYHVAAFREDLPTLLVAADVAVMRAGASVLGEIPAAGVAAILVPGRYAGGHQRNNAAWLADGGAAIVLDESEVGRLAEDVVRLLDDSKRLAQMRQAARALARPDAAEAIARLVIEAAR